VVGGTDNLAGLADGGVADGGVIAHQGLLSGVQPMGRCREALNLDDDGPFPENMWIGTTLSSWPARTKAACIFSNISGSRPGATRATAPRNAGRVSSGLGISGPAWSGVCPIMRSLRVLT
jgi:hypothetical protein